MCIATISLIAGLAGTAVSAVGSIQQGNYAGQVAKNNAKIATQNAAYSRQAGSEQAGITSMKGAARGADIKAGMAANGVDVNTGSNADVQIGNRETSTLDSETVLNNAELQAYGYTTQATNYEAQSKEDVAAGDIGAVGDILSGVSSLGSKWSTPAASAGNSWTAARANVFGPGV